MNSVSRELVFSTQYPHYHPRAGQPTNFVEQIYNSIKVFRPKDFINPLKPCGYDLQRIPYKHAPTRFMKANSIPPEYYQSFFRFHKNLDLTITSQKHHTIRAGKKWKEGDFIKPIIWAGKPYNKDEYGTSRIQFYQPIEVKKVWDFDIEIENSGRWFPYTCICINDKVLFYEDRDFAYPMEDLQEVAQNDGLSITDFVNWIQYPKKTFSGQIISWHDNIEYNL